MTDDISARLVESELNIPSFAIGLLSGDRLACVVPDAWFNCLCSARQALVLDDTVYNNLSSADARLLLSPSTSRLLSGWKRITLNVIKKCSKVVERGRPAEILPSQALTAGDAGIVVAVLPIACALVRRKDYCSNSVVPLNLIEQPLCLGQCSGASLSGIKAFVSEERRKCLQRDAEEKYCSAIQLTCDSDVYKPCLKDYNNFVHEVLNRVYCRHLIPLDDGCSSVDEGIQIEDDFQLTTHPGILMSYAVIESSKAFYVVHPFLKYTVSDLVTFSPSKLRDDIQNTKLFVLFELLKAVRHLHSCGISIYNLSLKDILIDDQLWLQIIPPPIEVLYRSIDVDDDSHRVLPSLDGSSKTSLTLPLFESSDLPSVVQRWVYREISNFDYLMILNQLAGRNTNDPNHYPILPWVTDFASPSRSLRDLTKTKYRLNKGDEQLDLTFDVSNPESIMRSTGQTPFHVSDFLSDITYYVYNARRTPKDVLCKFVRPRWVPNHYPISLQRLYEWTPDECIPEFFTDPQIFVSIHDDLPDLELPTWANSAEEFIRIHREILESDYVSENLHHWIDLTFGYKLSGSAAVSSKNICLQLVDRHKQLQNHGVVQLFSCPHPSRHHRALPSLGGEIMKELGARDAESVSSLTAIGQPKPNAVSALFALEQLESLYEFTMKTTNSLPPSRTSKKKDKQGKLQLLVARDMQTIGCLIVELFLPKTWAINQPANDLCRRYEHARRTCQANINELPLCIRQGVIYLLNLNETWNPDLKLEGSLGEVFRYPSVGLDGLPPPNIDILLHPSFCLLNFPVYFENLHTYLTKIKSLSVDCSPGSNKVNGQVENQKVSLLTNLLTRISHRMGPDGLSLVIPHILELLTNHVSSVQCAWSLFYPVAQALGPSASAQHLLPPLVSLFDTEETTVKYLKIYHRSFINQLIVRLGLDVFLNTFSTLLIEAVSGYKNFDSAADGCHGDGFVADVAGPVQLKDEVHPLQVEFFSEDQAADVDADEVFDGDLIDRDGQKLYTDEEEDVISVESGSLVSHEILSPAVDTDRKTSLNLDNISVGSDSRDLVVVTGDEVTGDADSRGGEGSSNDADGGICITLTPQKLNLTTDAASLVGSDGSDYNVANVAAETIKWLAHRLGPVLTAKHISRNLLRMLALCYIGEEQLTAIDCHGIFPSTTDKYVVGDKQAILLLECLAFIATLYGENIILLQYLQHVKELVPMLSKTFMVKSEGSLISCLVLLLYIIPYMSDPLLMDILQETLFVGILQPLMDVVASNDLSFPSGSLARRLACYRLIDVLCIISIRIGFENTRQHMTLPIQKLFEGFSLVHNEKTIEANMSSVEKTKNADTVPVVKKEGAADAESDIDADVLHEVRLNLNTNQFTVDVVSSNHKRQSSLGSLKQHSLSPSVLNNGTEESSSNPEATNCDRILQELRETFTPEMAHTAYVPICKLAGGIHVEQHLSNDDLIRSLCTLYDQSLLGQQRNRLPSVTSASLSGSAASGSSGKSSAPTSGDSVFGDNLIVEGNKIVIRKEVQMELDQGHTKMSILSCASESSILRNSDMKADTRRHLRGNWLAYWEHEVGLNDRVRDFNLKQITLQSFQGHSSAIRDLLVLDNENSFISASKDRTVKLWSLRSYGDGTAKVGCQWTYTKHKKAVSSVTFLDSIRLVASCDGNIHIWDPFMGMNVRLINAGKSFTVNVMSALPAPSSTILTASSDSILRFIDGRCGRFTHQFRTAIAPPGSIRSTAVSQDGRTVAVGFSTGLITALDLRTGYSLCTWKAHEAEIIEIKTFDSKRFVSSGLDQMISVWRHDDGKMMSSIKGLAEPVHRFSFYKDTVVAGSASNKVYVGSCIDSMAEFSCTKLKGDIFRGALSALTILPLNRLLMIGSDHGDIKLLA